MPAKKKVPVRKSAQPQADATVDGVLASLQQLGNQKTRDEMGSRYGIHTNKAFGVPMAKMLQLAKDLGQNHLLASALWKTGWYEARMVACMIDDPAHVTPAQMDRWCRDFDNWGICDTVCFKLFDQVPHAYAKVTQWAQRDEEFTKRGAFALLACLALHDKSSDDEVFVNFLPLIEQGARDDRNFVKKGVSWALRAIGVRSRELHAEAMALAVQLSASSEPGARWVGKDVARQLRKRA